MKYFVIRMGWPSFQKLLSFLSEAQQYKFFLIKIVCYFHCGSISPIDLYFFEIHYFWFVFGKFFFGIMSSSRKEDDPMEGVILSNGVSAPSP